MKYIYQTKNTCATEIEFEIDENVITNIKFINGCDGNLRMIGKLLDGLTATEIASKCKGNFCGYRMTSCADQLAIAVQKAQSFMETNSGQ